MSADVARNVLSRSGLDGNTLAKIWDLSNVTQEPQLTFPEFAVAMYLTSMRMAGRDIPTALPDQIRNEIETATVMVKSTVTSSAPPQHTGLQPMATGITPQRSLSTSMLSSLAGGQQSIPQQQQQQLQQQQSFPTGLQAQMTGMQPLPTGIRSQPTGMTALQSQPTGMTTGIQSQPTGMTMTGLPSQPTGMTTGLQSQPTGLQVPMMTGVTPMLVGNQQIAMPTGMGGNNLNFMNQMMPGAEVPPAGQDFQSLAGKVKIPWAVTTEEKKRYSKIFKAWDEENKGYLTGDKAKEIFTQSGLAQNILMQIWNLSDPNNQGKLNVDEFSVAMHLIYRKLNGYDVPTHLPTELVPPSTRELKESVDGLKKSILQDIATKRGIRNFSSSPSLSPPTQRTSRARSVSPGRKPTTAKQKYKDDDSTDTAYVSSARRMGPDRSRSGSVTPTASKSTGATSSYGYRGKQTRISDLRKQIKEHKQRIQELEEEAVARKAKPYKELSYTEQKDIDEVKEKVRELQSEIIRSGGDEGGHAWEKYTARTSELAEAAEQEKLLESEIQYLIETSLRGLVRQLRETEDDLAEKKKQAAKNKASKASTEPSYDIVGTGPNGEVTENDKIRAKAKAMVAARMGKITGKSNKVDVTGEIEAAEEERLAFVAHADSVTASLDEFQDAVNAIRMETSLLGLDIRKHEQDQRAIDERRRFESGEGVAADLKEFIQQVSFETATAKAPDVDPGFESRFPSFE
ncbi:hypothetical protein BDA99DRAFT_557454 [Phascolomyces articulosus]|uniref:Actin cytoskeleton-regulatory complex protein PAN1 n=1 Tax=Phascolomyces articulosus TaxID=60185 RepID=A0AAD5K5R4_9FUNG|nr:hypothetical protein BDA99DRAFT_557454 [Phascolomyces articulosus]